MYYKCGILHTTTRFYELRSIVQKVDEMFSDIVALNLTMSLGILCMSVYALLQKDGSSAGWAIPVTMSMVLIFVLLTPTTILNNKVSTCYKCLFLKFIKYTL